MPRTTVMNPSDVLKGVDAYRRHLATVARRLRELQKPVDGHNLGMLADQGRSLTKLEKEVEYLSHQWKELHQQLAALIHDRKHAHGAAMDQGRRRFGAQLESELRPLGLSLAGQVPELKAGLFTIELRFDKGRARLWYGPKEEQLEECKLSLADIVACLKKARQALGTKLDPPAFLSLLHRAYRRAGESSGGEPRPIVEVLAEVAPLIQNPRFRSDPRAEYYTSYSRADFSYDLFRASRAKDPPLFPIHFRLVVATRAHTRRRQDFLWVPSDERTGDGTRYSHIKFEETGP